MAGAFQGERVRLRAVEASDWEIHYPWNRDSEIGQIADEIWFPSSREQVRAWAENEAQRGAENDDFRFQIETLDGEFVGTLNTHHCNRRCGTFQYGLAVLPQHRRKGYASEAIRLVLRYYFRERRYQKVNVDVFSFNEASIRLHEWLRFVQEGRLRRMVYTGGQYFDVLLFGMTNEEFETCEQKTDSGTTHSG